MELWDWRFSVSDELRDRITKRIFTACFQNGTSEIEVHGLVRDRLYRSAREVETHAFRVATSKFTYYQGVQKEIEEIRKIKKDLRIHEKRHGIKEESPSPPPSPPPTPPRDTVRVYFHLEPVLAAISALPSSIPLRKPSKGLNDSSGSPLHLDSIRINLFKGQYERDAWACIYDVWRVIDHFKKRKAATSKVGLLFEKLADGAMKALDYCCGRRYFFYPIILYCSLQTCVIPKNANYFSYQDRYVVCGKCFNSNDKFVTLEIDLINTRVNKTELVKRRNNQVLDEPFVHCIKCDKKMHQICVGSTSPPEYMCDGCKKKEVGGGGGGREWKAASLKRTGLGDHMEKWVNGFLEKEKVAVRVIIRVLSSVKKTCKVLPGMKLHHNYESFPYRAKTLLVFMEGRGGEADVCFFGMLVQEYDWDCPEPNSGRVYISYLDSVNLFQPSELRTSVYQEIVYSYLDWITELGYKTAHIWACPPANDSKDYIFNAHPPQMKIPSVTRLKNWYLRLLEKGKERDVFLKHRSLAAYAQSRQLTSLHEIPYFDGDYWPDLLEEIISQHKDESTPRGGRPSKRRKTSPPEDLDCRLLKALEKHESLFFVVSLKRYPKTEDPDQLIECPLMDGRDAFLSLCRESWPRLEFSSLRRAKYATTMLLQQLNKQPVFVLTCNQCNHIIHSLRFHCNECFDFDLCSRCYRKKGHKHPMERMDSCEEKKSGMSVFVSSMDHASSCNSEPQKCPTQYCKAFKKLFGHIKKCRKVPRSSCRICQCVLLATVSHTDSCQKFNCPSPYCRPLKIKLRHIRSLLRRSSISYQDNI